MAQRKHPAGGWLHRPQAMSHRAVVSARPWHGWESYAFLAVQLHYDIAQGLENLMPETQHLETSDCFKTCKTFPPGKRKDIRTTSCTGRPLQPPEDLWLALSSPWQLHQCIYACAVKLRILRPESYCLALASLPAEVAWIWSRSTPIYWSPVSVYALGPKVKTASASSTMCSKVHFCRCVFSWHLLSIMTRRGFDGS